MKTVKEVSRLTGISVRTLHFYDEIGLLKPSSVTASGYRLYDEKALSVLQQILFFRELDFPLKEIADILNNPSYDNKKSLLNHRRLLQMKKDRLSSLIDLVDNLLKGDTTMSFQEFDMSEIDKTQKEYAAEAKERWGETDAYKESQQKAKSYSKEDFAKISAETEEIYQGFAALVGQNPASEEAQALVKDWQALISRYFYKCTDEILAGLGEMYVSDERFTKNIDKYKEGTAVFIRDAIRIYCK